MSAAAAPERASPERGAAISARGLERRFGDLLALRGVDLAVRAGEFVAVVGRSGCGKSTLLRLLARLDAPSAGAVEGGGAARLMFQEPRLLPWASVAANVAVGLPRGADAAGRRALALAALARVGLADRADAWPLALSGGQRQRVALARALVSRPRLLLLDEPLGALDALTRLEMQRLIEAQWREEGFTAVLVTHDVAEAVALADRVLVMEAGRVVLDQPVRAPRPRRRADPDVARLEELVLERVMARGEGEGAAPNYAI